MKKTRKEEVKALWKQCFNDSEAFVDLYFNLRYQEDQNITIQQEGKIISALQILPYPLTFCQETVQTAYISGACTHPDFRQKGIMKQLLLRAFNRMYKQGFTFSTLIPATPSLFHYYAQTGFATCFFYRYQEKTISCGSSTQNFQINPIKEFQDNVYTYLQKAFAQRSCCIQHTRQDFCILLEDLKISEGILLAAQHNQQTIGLVLAYRKGNKWEIQELLGDNPTIQKELVFALSNIHQDNIISECLPADPSEPILPLGMARIIDAQQVLQRYAKAFPQTNWQFQLIDEQLRSNNGFYQLYQGNCTYSKTPLANSSKLQINELTEQILLPLHPYMNLMMN